MARNALLFLASVVVALALCEGILRLTQGERLPNPGLYYLDPVIGKRMKPGFLGHEFGQEVRINAKGLRNREVPYEKPVGTFRILALGDSWTFGFRVGEEASYPRQLEGLLRERARTRGVSAHYEVINAGVIGYSTEQEAHYLRNEGYRFEPDLIVVAFYPVNDTHAKKSKYDRYIRLHSIHPWLLEAYTFPRSLYLRQFIKGTRRAVKARWNDLWLDWETRLGPDVAGAPEGAQVLPQNRSVMGSAKNWARDYESGNPGWESARAALLDIGEVSREVGARGVVILLPDLIDLARYQDRFHPRVEPLVRAAADEAGLDWIDLMEPLEAYRGREAEIRTGHDMRHPNALGYALLARMIAAELDRLYRVP